MNYYKYNFISPARIYAIVKEELKSYFDTGVVDDVLFPIWTKKCLDKLGRGSYDITEGVVYIKDGKGYLPDDFKDMRYAWTCTVLEKWYKEPSNIYSSEIKTTSTKLYDSSDVKCSPCDTCLSPDTIEVIYKTNNSKIFRFKRDVILVPKNQVVSRATETYEIKDGVLYVDCIDEGHVNIVYYVNSDDDCGDIMVPENYAIDEYIEAFLKYKCFEIIFNSVSDESVNILSAKLQRYENQQALKYVLANTETKKRTLSDNIRSINRDRKRLRKYDIR